MNLTPEILDRFESALTAEVPAIQGWLAPGLDDDAIDAIEAKLPGKFPLEAREWWKWKNGLLPDDALDTSKRGEIPRVLGGTEFALSSLQECLHAYESSRALAESQEVTSAEDLAPTDWFPIDRGQIASIRLERSPTANATLYSTYAVLSDGYGETFAGSLGDFVAEWTTILENGTLEWDPSVGWNVDRARLSEDFSRFGVS